MRKHVYVVSAALAAGALAAPAAASRLDAPAQPKTVRVSIDSGQRQGNNISGRSARPEVNATGSVVAFDSIANNLVHNDGNHANDVFVRDRMSGRTIRVSVRAAPARSQTATAAGPGVCGDGQFVVFDSSASNPG